MEKDFQIPEEISLLITRALTEELNEDEQLKLSEWLGEDKKNYDYFRSLAGTWILSYSAGKLAFDAEKSLAKLKERIKSEKKNKTILLTKSVLRWSAVAAAGLLVFILGILASQLSRKAGYKNLSSVTEIVCPLGSRTKIVLADSSEVWLNAGSRLKYSGSYNITERSVELEGEAFFSVEASKVRPFYVKTQGMVIKALGTKFNVSSYPEEDTEEAILVEGKIEVEVKKQGKTDDVITLAPNQKLIVTSESPKVIQVAPEKVPEKKEPVPVKPARVNIVSNVKTELYTSWKDDRWVIEREPLGTLYTKLERRYNVKFRFADDELKDYKFTGTIENETIGQILEALRLTAPVRYVIVKDSVILYTDPVLKEKYRAIVKK